MSLAQKVNGLGGSDIPAALGHETVRLGTGDLAAVAEVDLFTVIGGDILLTGLYGIVTTALSADNTLIQLYYTPTIGAAQVDLCAIIGAHIASDIAGTMYTITGAHGDAMATNGTTEGVIIASFATNMVILVPGVISLNVSAFGNDGVIQWTLHWIPLSEQSDVYVT